MQLRKIQEPITIPPSKVLVWSALLFGPAAWAMQLQAVYFFTQLLCEGRAARIVLHSICAGCLALSLVGLAMGLIGWRATGGAMPSETDREAIAHARLLSVEGILTRLLFSVVIIAQWLAVVFVPPCPP